MSDMFGNLYGDEDQKEKPILNFHFALDIDGIHEAGFNRVSAVALEMETESYQEGGVNHFTHVLPTRMKYSNVVLERGVTTSKTLLNWFMDVQNGIITKKDFSIVLWNASGGIVRRWNFKKGYPIKWEASDLDAMGNSVIIEKIEMTHEGMSENA